MTDPAAPPPPKPPRLASLDAYRGFVMLLMLGEVLQLPRIAKAIPTSGFWSFLAWHQSHVPWIGCSLHDLIQPSFSFLVGAALPFSLAGRGAQGQTRGQMIRHAAWRAFVLVALGVFLRSIDKPQTNFTFDDTLCQIGLGYVPLFLLGLRSVRVQAVALGVVLFGYGLAFALYPAPGPGFDWKAVGVPADWPHHLTGFAAHWNKNSNLAWAFDRWFLNLFPRPKPFAYSGGGYATLNFIPTLGTMILGLLAGTLLKGDRLPKDKLRLLAGAGVAALAAGWLLGALGVCPVVKRIWTPTWVLFSGGWCFLLTAGFYGALDVAGRTRAAFVLIVVGTNSIAAYCMEWLAAGFLRGAVRTHLPAGLFRLFGTATEPLVEGALVLALMWLILLWMYRRKIFLKV
jgi:heparan-alpha-glucosaminide N-acetyltransferase